MVHVYVTTEKYRQYEERMKNALGQMERRFVWFQMKSVQIFAVMQKCLTVTVTADWRDW